MGTIQYEISNGPSSFRLLNALERSKVPDDPKVVIFTTLNAAPLRDQVYCIVDRLEKSGEDSWIVEGWIVNIDPGHFMATYDSKKRQGFLNLT